MKEIGGSAFMVYPFLPLEDQHLEAMRPTLDELNRELYDCEFCGHSGWYHSENGSYTCPRCGKRMERI